MDLYKAISTRKSVRSYTDNPLPPEKLSEVQSILDSVEPLDQKTRIQYRFAAQTKGLYHVKAPHYVIASGEGKPGEMASAGFLLQHLVLWLDTEGLGSVWLGSAKDVNKNKEGEDLIVLAFGASDESVHRELSEFKRKPINEITNAPEDALIQAVHLAPSGMNLQPWYLKKTEDRILLYEQILKGPVALAYKKTEVDMGIALCHYAVAAKQFNRSFSFKRSTAESDLKGYRLFGEISE